ncbi:serine hydrolase domain-containing protein [Nitratireductor basaltis]|nr:serine hydrolase domain-containing protein [Nitratireductor basaltis]
MRQPGLDEDVLRHLAAAMDRHVEARLMSGAVWAIEQDGELHVATAGTFEMGEGRPMARDTIFRVASITKPVTALLAMMLVEEGRLSLDGPVKDLLPELAEPRVLRSIDGELDDTQPAHRPITLRHLLTMTFGLGAIMEFPPRYPIQLAMQEAGIAPNWVLPRLTADEYMTRLGELPLAAHPGERFLYNNGLDVAGILIERAEGRSLGEVMRERIFEPLGMVDTGFWVPREKLDRLPPQYGPDFAAGTGETVKYGPERGINFAAPPPLESGAGGLVTTIDDYLAFQRLMLNGGVHEGKRLISEASLAEMTRDQLQPQHRNDPHAAFFMEDGGASWGLGVSVTLDRVHPWMTPGRYGWNGGYGTTAYVDPEKRLIGAFFSQQIMSSPSAPEAHRDFWSHAYRAVP